MQEQLAYLVRVTHELGFFSFYEVKGDDTEDVKREAKRRFINDFCGGHTRYEIETYVFPYQAPANRGSDSILSFNG